MAVPEEEQPEEILGRRFVETRMSDKTDTACRGPDGSDG
jgi:hypothetical protein